MTSLLTWNGSDARTSATPPRRPRWSRGGSADRAPTARISHRHGSQPSAGTWQPISIQTPDVAAAHRNVPTFMSRAHEVALGLSVWIYQIVRAWVAGNTTDVVGCAEDVAVGSADGCCVWRRDHDERDADSGRGASPSAGACGSRSPIEVGQSCMAPHGRNTNAGPRWCGNCCCRRCCS